MLINVETRNKVLELIAARLKVSVGVVEAEINKNAVDDLIEIEIDVVKMHIRRQKSIEANQYEPTQVELRAALEAKKPIAEPK